MPARLTSPYLCRLHLRVRQVDILKWDGLFQNLGMGKAGKGWDSDQHVI